MIKSKAQAESISSRITMRQLEAFDAVATGGGITAGAAIVRLSQPSVTRLILDLERNLGFSLFTRERKRLTITPEGQRFHEEVARSFAGIERLAKAAEDIRVLRARSLRLATIPTLAFGALPRTIAGLQFDETARGVRVLCEQRNSEAVLAGAASQNLDVGLALGGSDPPGVRTFAQFRMRCVCVMQRTHPLAGKSTVTMEDLRHTPFVSLPRYTQVMLQLFKMLDEAGIRPEIRIETLISSTACAMVSQGIGVSIVDPLSAKLFENQNITFRPFELAIDFTFRIIHPTRGPTSRLAKSFMEILAVELESEPEVLRVE